jgi:hypothetical protein
VLLLLLHSTVALTAVVRIRLIIKAAGHVYRVCNVHFAKFVCNANSFTLGSGDLFTVRCTTVRF